MNYVHRNIAIFFDHSSRLGLENKFFPNNKPMQLFTYTTFIL